MRPFTWCVHPNATDTAGQDTAFVYIHLNGGGDRKAFILGRKIQPTGRSSQKIHRKTFNHQTERAVCVELPPLSYALSIDFSHFPASLRLLDVFRPVLTIALPFQRHYGDGAHWMMMSVEVCWRVGLGGRWRKISYYPLLGWGRWAMEITFKKKRTHFLLLPSEGNCSQFLYAKYFRLWVRASLFSLVLGELFSVFRTQKKIMGNIR